MNADNDVRKSYPLQVKYISVPPSHLSNDGSGYWTKSGLIIHRLGTNMSEQKTEQ